MKQLVTLCVMLIISVLCFGQDSEMIVEPDAIGSLDQAIFGDTTETGERQDPNRIYVLKRGAPYLISQSIRFSDFHLRIKAEEGEGAKPILIFNVDAGGETLDQLFRLDDGADLTIEGVHISCNDILGNRINRAVRLSGDGGKVYMDQCIVGQPSQSAFRLNADSIKVFVKNSLFNRIGEPFDPNNGRFMDNRGHPIDSLVVENCVVYAVSSRFYRNGSGALLHNGIFNQNTFYGAGQLSFSWGELDNLTFTNNIVANTLFLGLTTDTSSPVNTGLRYMMELDTFISGEDQVWVSNNNFFISDEYVDALPEVNVYEDTVISARGLVFDPVMSNAVMESASSTDNINEILAFADEPNIQTQFIMAWHADSNGASDGIDGAGDWDFSDLTPDPVYSAVGGQGIDRFTTFHDFSYPESAQSYTAGTNGQKLGADLTNLGTDVDEDFFVTDNILFYPNPVKDELFIQNLDEVDLKSVYIYDVQGHPLRRQDVNAMNIRFQMGKLPPGIYMLSVEDHAGKVSTRQILKY